MRHSQTDRLSFRKCEQRFQGKRSEDMTLTLIFVWTVLLSGRCWCRFRLCDMNAPNRHRTQRILRVQIVLIDKFAIFYRV
jgi:hypothetical protein